jgi:hypothetical protein
MRKHPSTIEWTHRSVLAKPLEDGSVAVGLFNVSERAPLPCPLIGATSRKVAS